MKSKFYVKKKEDVSKGDVVHPEERPAEFAFYLEEDSSGNIALMAEDSLGQRWNIVYISVADGKLHKCGRVYDGIGLCLNRAGQIKTAK